MTELLAATLAPSAAPPRAGLDVHDLIFIQLTFRRGTEATFPARVGARIRAARIAAGLSQRELAALLHCGQPAVNTWEAGTRAIGPDRLAEIADAVQVSLLWFFPSPPLFGTPPGRG